MSTGAIALLGVIGLLALIFARVPIALALAAAGLCGYAALDGWGTALKMFGRVPFTLASAYSLSVIPLFILMGAVASRGKMARELFDACNGFFSGLRGALANATIGASALFDQRLAAELAESRVVVSVSGDLMAAANIFADERRARSDVLSDQEERCRHAQPVEHREVLRGQVVGSIVERQCHPVAFDRTAANDPGQAIEHRPLHLGTHRDTHPSWVPGFRRLDKSATRRALPHVGDEALWLRPYSVSWPLNDTRVSGLVPTK